MTDSATDTTDPVAKPWYTSMTVLAILASMIMSAATKLGLVAWLTTIGVIPPGFDVQQLAAWLFVAIPAALAIYGRFRASHSVTLTAAGAKVLNDQAIAKS